MEVAKLHNRLKTKYTLSTTRKNHMCWISRIRPLCQLKAGKKGAGWLFVYNNVTFLKLKLL